MRGICQGNEGFVYNSFTCGRGNGCGNIHAGHININALRNGKNVAVYTLGHEITHYIKEWSPAKFKTLSDFVMDKLGGDAETLIDEKLALLRKIPDYKDYTVAELTDLAAEEVVADGMELVLTDGKVLEELSKTDKSLWEKIRDWFFDIIGQIRRSWQGLNQASKTAQVLAETMESLDEIERMFTEGVKEAGERTRTAGVETVTRMNEENMHDSEKVYSFKGYAEDGKKIYESNFPKGTPKAAKSERILNYIQNVWSKKPIPLVISNGETSRTIYAQFDPTMDETQNIPSDASKLAGGNRHGTHSEQRITLDLADDYYDIASSASYNYSKLETGKELETHDGVIMWHYFVEDIYFSEYGSEETIPFTVTINVKEKANGDYVYSFNAEKESPTRRTLHADVNTRKGANGELFLDDSIPQPEDSVNRKYSISENIPSTLSTEDQALLFDTEFYERYESESQEPITETVEELETIKASDAFASMGYNEAFDLNAKLKAKRAGYDTIYDYYVETEKQRMMEEYRRYAESGRENRTSRLLNERRKAAQKEQKLRAETAGATPLQNAQYQIIQETNPMWDEYHTGIRSPKDIKTFAEVVEDSDSFNWGDFTREDAEKALRDGTVRVYSSYAIKNGVFVSTSYKQALQYAGNNPDGVHTRVVALDSVAWINGDEGQYAKVYKSEKRYSLGEDSGTAAESPNVSENRDLTDREMLLAMAEQMVGNEAEFKIVSDYKAKMDEQNARQARANELTDEQEFILVKRYQQKAAPTSGAAFLWYLESDHAHAKHSLQSGEVGLNGCGDVAGHIEDGVSGVTAGLVGHVLDVQTLVGHDGGELGQHTGDVLVQHADTGIAGARHGDGGEVHAVLDVTVLEVVVHLEGGHDGAVVLGLLGGCAQVGDQDGAGNADQLLSGEVGDVAGDLAAGQRLDHVGGLNEGVAGEVDDLHAVLHVCHGSGVDHALGVGGGGDVDGDVVSHLVDLLVGGGVGDVVVQVPSGVYGQEGIATDHLHTQTDGDVGHQTADSTQTDDTEGLALQLTACELGLVLLHGLGGVGILLQSADPLDTGYDVTGGQKQGADGQLLDAVGVGTGGVEHHDTLLGAFVQRNVVDTGACAGDGQQLGVEVHIQHVGGANHDALGGGYLCADVVQSGIQLIGTDLGDLVEQLNVFHDGCSPFEMVGAHLYAPV